MSCQPRGWALPWVVLLLLMGPQLLVTQGLRIQEDKDRDGRVLLNQDFPATVEYALHMFNIQSEDTNAYRLERILNSWTEQIVGMIAFSMELLLRRTRCEKWEEDIDNCPFQSGPQLNNTYNCFFTIGTHPWETYFELLNKTCLEGFH
ncbi:PREDICTED: cystatin-9-like [Condylura cristata]|uniref:cystatin-9-like n=1 Tax=Condylura cristata TaxID=143302 RepID=UPI0003347D03|nr:PREDICTED: cystatin-9-like [Condylura cristata]